MLSPKEEAFIKHWEKNSAYQKTFQYKLLMGLPKAFLFMLPVVILILGVYLFIPQWYTKVSNSAGSSAIVILLSVGIFSTIFAVWRMQFIWEKNDAYYKSLLFKKNKNTIVNG